MAIETLKVDFNSERVRMIYYNNIVTLKMTTELREFIGRMDYAHINGFDVSVSGSFEE